ncbi:MAG: ankyrin repeat domain-containing protein [Planctomycetota bacterium]
MDYAPLIPFAFAPAFLLGGCRFVPPADARAAVHRHPPPDDPVLARAVAMMDEGDAVGLRGLLGEHPALVRQRVRGGHDWYTEGYFKNATLLHFVAINPCFEGERLPANLVEMARVILDAGAEVDAGCGENGEGTTLGLVVSGMRARTNGLQEPLIRLLVERGATMGRAIDAALGQNEPGAARLLVELGTEKTLPDHAAFGEVREVQRVLAGRGATIETKRRALERAARYGHAAVVSRLCSVDGAGLDPGGFNPEAPGYDGRCTPLHLAAYHGHLETARVLVRCGANHKVRDTMWNGTPRDWAKHGGHGEVAAWLDGLTNRETQEGAR